MWASVFAVKRHQKKERLFSKSKEGAEEGVGVRW